MLHIRPTAAEAAILLKSLLSDLVSADDVTGEHFLGDQLGFFGCSKENQKLPGLRTLEKIISKKPFSKAKKKKKTLSKNHEEFNVLERL